ncbi:MAG TPA: hypothetical protein VGG31_06305, partial [Candidatus Dormibacteraeota bacterium]
MTPAPTIRRAIATGTVALIVCAGCNSPSVIEGPRLASNQTLRVMLQDEPSTLDPGQTQYPYENAVLRAISEPLVK